MDYYESAEGETISLKRAMRELDDHGVPFECRAEFFAEVGYKEEYDAQEVLAWLGY